MKYPDVKVQLTGEDGNAFAIMGAVSRALREAGVSEEDCKDPMCSHPDCQEPPCTRS